MMLCAGVCRGYDMPMGSEETALKTILETARIVGQKWVPLWYCGKSMCAAKTGCRYTKGAADHIREDKRV